MTQDERVSLQRRADRLGITKDWKTVVAWANETQNRSALTGILETLEGTTAWQIADLSERDTVAKIAGRAKNTVKNTPATPGAVAEARAICEALVAAIDRAGVDLMYWPATKGPPRWDGQRFAEINKRAFWRYDGRLFRAGDHLLAARRILAEPPPHLPEFIKAALAKRKPGRPRKCVTRASVERTLITQLKAITPPGETRARARSLATRLLKKVFPS